MTVKSASQEFQHVASMVTNHNDVEARIRERAYQLYEQRNRGDGFALEDWLQAEAEILIEQSQADGSARRAAQ